ncbi:hypothetical protein [Lacticaseibacillus parakribbianus]|uniref:hypothetical protein n=1 Tax=Lacticaseibacillus parakribbianus TaxID=2970927 RepID=UPI0021CB3627|nr:hypothetical protein [Lacticaseibacillus parakribbianus]
MPLFHNRAAKAFQAQLHQLFSPADLYFIYQPDQATLQTTTRTYSQQFLANGARKALGLIDETDAGIIPYLSVQANLLINGQTQSFALIPAALRRDLVFLDQPARDLTPAQSLYVQLFRGLFAGRQFLLMADFPQSMTLQEKRLFMDTATTAVRQTNTSLLVLTTDTNLVAAHPATSWWAAPDLQPTAAAQ